MMLLIVLAVLLIFLSINFYRKPIEFFKTIQFTFLQWSGYRSKVLKTENGQIDYYEGGEGETIILIHGLMVHAGNWVNVAPKLIKDYHVVIPNLPGHGTSPWPTPNDATQFGYIIIDFLLKVSKDKPVTLVGNSMGGGVAFQFSLEYPERVKNLIVVNSAGLKWELNQKILFPETRQEALTKIKSIVNAKMNPPNFFLDAMIRQDDSKFRVLLKSAMESDDFFMEERFNDLKIKTHLLWGENDGLFSMEYAKKLQRLLPDCEFTLLPNDAHVPHNTNPKAVISYIYSVMEAQNRN